MLYNIAIEEFALAAILAIVAGNLAVVAVILVFDLAACVSRLFFKASGFCSNNLIWSLSICH